MGLPRIFSVLALGGAALLCAKMAVADPAAESRAIAPQGLAAYRAVYELSLSDSASPRAGPADAGAFPLISRAPPARDIRKSAIK